MQGQVHLQADAKGILEAMFTVKLHMLTHVVSVGIAFANGGFCMQAVLAEQGKCPFTKNDLSWEQCTTLTRSNIDRYRDRIKSL